MKQRISIKDLEPKAYQAMFGLKKYLSVASLDIKFKNLINVRVSQINGCAYCIDAHTDEALQDGEEAKRIFSLSAWWESTRFTDQERALLAMTDEVTLIADKGLSEPSYQEARKHFSENEIAQAIMQMATMNVWNRIAISTHMVYQDAKSISSE